MHKSFAAGHLPIRFRGWHHLIKHVVISPFLSWATWSISTWWGVGKQKLVADLLICDVDIGVHQVVARNVPTVTVLHYSFDLVFCFVLQPNENKGRKTFL